MLFALRRSRVPRLYRYYACGPDGEDATTLAIVSAHSDDDAMVKGAQQFPQPAFSGYLEAYGIHPGDEEGPFLSCEELKVRFDSQGETREEQIEDAGYVLQSMPGFIGLPDNVLDAMAAALVDAVAND